MTEIIGAFTEEQTASLAGVSRGKLHEWDRRGLLSPSLGVTEPHVPYGRLYSFRDLVSARVIGQLREAGVSYPDLMRVHAKLASLSDTPWSSTVLYVLGKQVVIKAPGSRHRHNPLTNQQVFDIPLKVVISGVRADIAKLNERREPGRIERDRFVSQNQYVIAGTRIPVADIQSFAAAKYSTARILKEYPSLSAEDVAAAVAFGAKTAA
jgi:uncharacterized protein (DUF433 family)